MSIEDEAKRIEADINARADALMAGPRAIRLEVLGRVSPRHEFPGFGRSRDPIPLPRSDDRAEIIRALAADLPAEWEWTVAEAIGGDAEFIITGHRPPVS